jgi:ribosomal protein S18 acetylase RimI-like enzyme
MFFERVDDSKFHPHPFSIQEATRLCNINSKDLYYVVMDRDNVAAYGMLRGWDEGYDVPSLGIYVSSDYRGLGIGKMFMQFLHCAAKNAGAKRIRLKVDRDNTPAVMLYDALGYKLEVLDDKQYLGFIEL